MVTGLTACTSQASVVTSLVICCCPVCLTQASVLAETSLKVSDCLLKYWHFVVDAECIA